MDASYDNNDMNSIVHWDDSLLLKSKTSFLLGENWHNKVVWDLQTTNNLMIGRMTGSGKSFLVKLIILQAIKKKCYKIILFDLKGVDFNHYWRNHCQVIDDIEDVNTHISNLVNEMNRRKKLFNDLSDKKQLIIDNIRTYNKHSTKKIKRIILVIDEFADISIKSKEITENLSLLARKSRAFGISIVVCTQRPSAKIMPEQLRSNINYRICGVADEILSEIVLDSKEASSKIPSESKGAFVNHKGELFNAYLLDKDVY